MRVPSAMKGALLLLTATFAFRGATVVDGTGAPPRTNALLVVSDGRVVSLDAASDAGVRSLPRGARVSDLAGKWIVPGLIDAHVHAESDADLKEMLRWGITSVRLMAEDAAAASTLARDSRGRGDVPDVFPAAPIFTTRGGWWGRGEAPDANLDRFPDAVGKARAAVAKAKDLGSAEIKLMLDDMAWCRGSAQRLPRMRPEIAAALAGEARRLGLRVIVHAPGLDDAKEAIAAGATALAHGVLEPIDAETVSVMKTRPVFYVPTLDIFEFLADTRAFVDSVLSDPAVTRGTTGLSGNTLARLRSRAYSDGYRERYPNFENVARHLPILRENLRRLHAAGVPVALGTDMWAFPGLGASIEMDLYVRAGLTPLEAIQAATRVAARSLGVDGDRGTLEPGKRADFLVLSADPVSDVRNVRRIDAVYKSGVRVATR